MHFLEAARFLNAPVFAGRKLNELYDPGLAARLPPHYSFYSCSKVFGPCNNHSVLICIKLPMNLFFSMGLAAYDFAAGQRHYLGHWKGWAMKVDNFLGPETTTLFSFA